MDPGQIRPVSGTSAIVSQSETTDAVATRLSLDTGDPRFDGEVEVTVDRDSFARPDLGHATGSFRITNDWGSWEGPVDISRDPSGLETQNAWLAGQDAYDGFWFFYHSEFPSTGTERVVGGPSGQVSLPRCPTRHSCREPHGPVVDPADPPRSPRGGATRHRHATNGRNEMRRVRMTLIGILALVLSAAPVVALAQTPEEVDPTVLMFTTISETLDQDVIVSGTIEQFIGGNRAVHQLTGTIASEDPRLAGDPEAVYTLEWNRSANLRRGSGIVRIVNADGAWEGPFTLVEVPDGPTLNHGTLVGEGAYSGLTRYEFHTESDACQPTNCVDVMVWPGELPPLPDTVSMTE